MKFRWIIPLCVLIFASSCADHSILKRRYTKGFHFASSGKVRSKHSDQAARNELFVNADTLVLAKPASLKVFPNENIPSSEVHRIHASMARSDAHQKHTTNFKLIQPILEIHAVKLNNAVKNKMIEQGQTKSDGWLAALKILAIIALILVVLGMLYVAFVLILLGGAFSGGAIYADPGFRMLMLLLLGLIILAAYLMYLVATADVNTYYKHDTNTSYDLNQNIPFKKNYFFDLLIFLKKFFIIVAIVILFLTIAYITIISLSNPITYATILILLFSILLLLLSAYKLKNDL